MRRRSQQAVVAERAEARLAEQQERRRQAAQRGAQTRQQRREGQTAEAQPQAGAESPTQGHVARRSRPSTALRASPRAHPDLLTVAIRGHFAARMRALSESSGISLAKLLKDALLVYEGDIEGGYEPGSRLRGWQERQAEGAEQTE